MEQHCYHCGTACGEEGIAWAEKPFCCRGCLTVYSLLAENGLAGFYELSPAAGVRIDGETKQGRYAFLDDPAVRVRLVDYQDDRLTRVTFRLPAVHCVACVWLLENLFRLNPGIGRSQVNFSRKDLAVSFDTAAVALSDVAQLLASLGYEPDLNLGDLDRRVRPRDRERLWLQAGIAGFAFGNIMLFSLASYLGLGGADERSVQVMFGAISLILAIPVLVYSARDYWRSAWASLRQKRLAIEVPIAAGLAAIFGQSAYEVISRTGEGYFDTLTGLLFFLLCGRVFQQKTFERLTFDRDYKAFFPLSVRRLREGQEEQVALSQLAVGDRLLIRNGELLPADARVVHGPAVVDYSFVTGESAPVTKEAGEYLHAGGRHTASAVEVEIVKEVSQSYLASLWNQEAFRKENSPGFDGLTNRYSERFTRLVLTIATGAGFYWAVMEPALALKSFMAVLIVACPCALALAAPFALGTAQRALARRNVFLKNSEVIEQASRIDTVVFDKTGTLTLRSGAGTHFRGPPLNEQEQGWTRALASQSTHPLSARVRDTLFAEGPAARVELFHESAGEGVEGTVDGVRVLLGSAAWLKEKGIDLQDRVAGSVHLAIDGGYRGSFLTESELRPEIAACLARISATCETALLSGDNDRDMAVIHPLFPSSAALKFHQSPMNKLDFIRARQHAGRKVMMVGDGLNDAGALKQSDLGVAVVEDVAAFSPASDVIMEAGMVRRLDAFLDFSRSTARVVRISFLISALYNAVGIAIAAQGLLSPLVCAVLMPLSSITVVAFACGATTWAARRIKVIDARPARDASDPFRGRAGLPRQMIPAGEV